MQQILLKPPLLNACVTPRLLLLLHNWIFSCCIFYFKKLNCCCCCECYACMDVIFDIIFSIINIFLWVGTWIIFKSIKLYCIFLSFLFFYHSTSEDQTMLHSYFVIEMKQKKNEENIIVLKWFLPYIKYHAVVWFLYQPSLSPWITSMKKRIIWIVLHHETKKMKKVHLRFLCFITEGRKME